MQAVSELRLGWVRRLGGLGLSLGLALAALLLLGRWVGGAAAAGSPAARALPSAVTYTVTNALDLPDSDVSDGNCHAAFTAAGHHCTLRAALQQLDHDAGGTVILPSGTYVLSDTGDGDLQLTQDIQIDGASSFATTIEGNPAGWAHRLVRVQNGANVSISNVTLRGGHISGGDGGGLDVMSGKVLLEYSTIVTSTADNGGGIYNAGTLTLVHDVIEANQAATGYGGGVYNAVASGPGPNLTVSGSTFLGNIALLQAGGGAYNLGHMEFMTGSMDLNTARVGGGFFVNTSAQLTITSSDIDFNQATGTFGGGLDSNGVGALTAVVNSTFSGNHARNFGGGIADEHGSVDLSSVTLADNFIGTTTVGSGLAAPAGGLAGGGIYVAPSQPLTLRNSLVAHNTAHNAPDCFGTIDSLNFNLVQNISGCTLTDLTSHNVTGQDPGLWPLGDYGGPTVTYALLPNSPAIDAGNSGGCRDEQGHLLSTDQRGDVRSFDGDGNGVARCDIGAFELSWAARVFLPLLER